MAYENIIYEVENGVAKLILNRPKALNSFTQAMFAEVHEALASLKQDSSARVLLISGAGRGFCAGQDLNDRAVAPGETTPDLGESLENNYNPLIRTLAELPLPVICAVNGVAAGAGANIALACDIVIAAKSASFIQSFCKLGLVPDSGGTWILPHLVGRARAMGLAMLGDRLSAEQAQQWGMIWQVYEDDELAGAADAMAQHFAVQPTKGLALIKAAIRAAATNTLDQHLDLERDFQASAGKTQDYREGVAAFLAKREPRFTGK